jgi:hypothetical protein
MLTEVTLPTVSMTVCNSAPVPFPVIATVGATLYPLPGLLIVTLVILPLVITGIKTA